MRINVQTRAGTTLKLHVKATDTMAMVANQINEKDGLMAPDVRLMTPMHQSLSLMDYKVVDGATLYVTKTSVLISVKPMEGHCFNLDIDANETVGKIKEKITTKTGNDHLPDGIPPHIQRLRWNGEDLHDDSKFSDLPIPAQARLSLRWCRADLQNYMEQLELLNGN